MPDHAVDNAAHIAAAEKILLDSVLESYSHTPDPRLREVLLAMLRHLHAWASEVRLTQDEWLKGILFLTATGQKCDERRQEFILLSDNLGLSSLVEYINYQGRDGATENTVFGPFYVPGSKVRARGESMVEFDQPGDPAVMVGTVRSTDGTPLAGATLDAWMADARGLYAVQDPEIDQQNLRGVYTTAADGSYELAAIRPTPYPIPTDGPVGELLGATARHPWRPGHLHFRVSAPGHVPVTMHVFEQTSAYLDSDAVFGVRDSLIVPFAPQPDGVYRADFDFVLSPA